VESVETITRSTRLTARDRSIALAKSDRPASERRFFPRSPLEPLLAQINDTTLIGRCPSPS